MRGGKRRRDLDVEGVRLKFARWRRTRNAGARIPEELWASAVEVASVRGVCQTAKAFALGYYALKERVERSTAAARRRAPRQAAFVQLPLSVVGQSEAYIIEFENHRGAKMRIVVHDRESVDLVALGQRFWSTE